MKLTQVITMTVMEMTPIMTRMMMMMGVVMMMRMMMMILLMMMVMMMLLMMMVVVMRMMMVTMMTPILRRTLLPRPETESQGHDRAPPSHPPTLSGPHLRPAMMMVISMMMVLVM